MVRSSSSQPAPAAPRPLAIGERVELWLQTPAVTEPEHASPFAPRSNRDRHHAPSGKPEGGARTDEWDVRPALVAALSGCTVALVAGTWPVALSPVVPPPGNPLAATAPSGRPLAMIRRLTSEGIAEWRGHLAPPGTAATPLKALDGPAHREAPSPFHLHGDEQLLIFIASPRRTAGRLLQRRRSPRVALRLTPVRLVQEVRQADGHHTGAGMDAGQPLATGDAGLDDRDLLPVARLTDVSLHGAGVVIDCPLPQGTPVSLEFELPGEPVPFVVRGRVIEPAVPLHGEIQPQVDGLPGFRRGIEFLGTPAAYEARRLQQALAQLLHLRSGTANA